jgi:hypothetical protein
VFLAATNRHAKIEELLEALCGTCHIKFSIGFERKVGNFFFLELLVCNASA